VTELMGLPATALATMVFAKHRQFTVIRRSCHRDG
jgi:hypothetical protein